MSQEIRKILAINVKKLRTKAGLKKEKLSLALGFDNSYISKLEKGNVNITIDKIAKIAKFFNVKVIELLSENLK